MTALVSQAIGAILTNCYAVVEGTGSYKGVPGLHSLDELLRGSGLTFTAMSTGSTTTIEDNTVTAVYASDRFTKTKAPSFWALCLTSANAASAVNVGAARKISSWSQSATTLTTAAFPATTLAGDTFSIREGFRGVVDGSGEDATADRRVSFDLEPGDILDWRGAGYRTVRGELVASLSLASGMRAVSARRAAVENAEILREAISRRDHWESTYTRAIMIDGSSIDIDAGPDRATVEIRWPIVYRFATLFA